jgi:hypothetical protein
VALSTGWALVELVGLEPLEELGRIQSGHGGVDGLSPRAPGRSMVRSAYPPLKNLNARRNGPGG